MRIGLFSVADHYPSEVERSVSQLYRELLEQCELADKLGFDSFWVAEHHFNNYGVIPRAALFLGAAAQRTTRIRLGAAVVVLPFDNPVRTAEDYAMVDALSGGRLNIGVGSGYLQHEFAGFGLEPSVKRDQFNEGLEILERLWSGETLTHEGKYNSLRDVSLNVLPVQKPLPPRAVAVLNNEAAKFVGATGRDLMMIPYATATRSSDLRAPAEAFHHAAASSSTVSSSSSSKLYFALHTYCGASSDAAKQSVQPYLDRYVRTRLYAKQRPFSELVDADLLAVGDATDIANVLKRYEEMGFTDFLALVNFGGMPHAEVCQSMQRLADSVIPRFSAVSSSAHHGSV